MSLPEPPAPLQQDPLPLRVMIVDDHAVMRRMVIQVLGSSCEIIAELDRGDAIVATAGATNPDVIVLDITMPGLDGIEATRRLVAAGSTAKIVMLTVHDELAMVRAALEAGATAYVHKAWLARDLVEAIRRARQGERWVSPGIGQDRY